MAYPSVILDGSAPYGSVTLTFSGGTTAIADDFSIDQPYATAEDNTVNATPNRLRATRQRMTGSATLQSPSGTTARVAPGETFSITFDSGVGSKTFCVYTVGWTVNNEPTSMRKFPITFFEVINTITTVA